MQGGYRMSLVSGWGKRTACSALLLGSLTLWSDACGAQPASYRAEQGVPPTVGCWFWREAEFQRNGYRPFLDMIAAHASYDSLTTSIRAPGQEVTSSEVHDQIRQAAEYAREQGVKLIMDLDLRLARSAFERRYGDEMQEMLRLREVPLSETGAGEIRIASEMPSDHYTFRATPYVPRRGRLVRVYSYLRGPAGIEPQSVRDITETACRVEQADAQAVSVTIADTAATEGCHACVMVAFTHFAPDVFAPHLLAFQREILAQYRDVPLGGVCKDEWGFPPCFDGNPAKDDYWYSRFLADAYRMRTGGRDLLRDALLMTYAERGREPDRQAAINHFMQLCRERNEEVEDDFYHAVKKFFGTQAVVATHPTWWPYPDSREFKKNGLDWWSATRDWAQVDETTPFCVRTALAKKWRSGIWYNMFYATDVASYQQSLWSHALANGRINYHPLYPRDSEGGWGHEELLAGPLTRGDCRVRLLNFITTAPVDCPVAIVFGHACAMNWAGPSYDDVGMALADRMWQAGFYADLIPSSEITSGALAVDEQGFVRYGAQRYTAVVFYHPQFERREMATLLQQINTDKTALFRVGDWSRDFEGQPLDGNSLFPATTIIAANEAHCEEALLSQLEQTGVVPQQPATNLIGWNRMTAAPPAAGHTRLLDATHIIVSGQQDAAGDPVQVTLAIDGRNVTFDCQGLAAVRLDSQGQLEAMAAGGLRHFRAGEQMDIALTEPADVALWRDNQGTWHGVLQGYTGDVPAQLTRLTDQWLRLNVPPPLPH